MDHTIVGIVDHLLRVDPGGLAMILGRVAGEVVTTIAHPFSQGRILLPVERTDPSLISTGGSLIAVGAIGAGVGQHLLALDKGNGARQVFASADAPVRAVLGGIVDHAGQPAARNASDDRQPARLQPARQNICILVPSHERGTVVLVSPP